MTVVRIEPHYLPSIEYFVVLSQADEVFFDLDSRFRKQTHRNRTRILGPNGIQNLSIPVHFKNDSPLKDVTIDYRQSWLRDHWGAIYSSYGKSPFFEHFAEYFQSAFQKKPKYLIDLNMEMLSVCLKILQWQIVIKTDPPESGFIDLGDKILAKKPFETRGILLPVDYQQNFGNTFVPNLSILDLLFCQGPDSSIIIRESVKNPIERIAN